MIVKQPKGPRGYEEYLEGKFKALEDRLAAVENKCNTDATGSSGSTVEMLISMHRSILNDPHTPDELQSVYLGQIALMLGSLDDDLKALRQTLSNMTGVIKEVKSDKNN